MAYSRRGLGVATEGFVGVVSVDSIGQVRFRYPGINGPVCGPADVLQELVDEYRSRGPFSAVLYGERTSRAVGPRWCEWTIDSWEFAPADTPASDTAVGTSDVAVADFQEQTSGTDTPPEQVPSQPDPRTTVEQQAPGEGQEPIGAPTSPDSIQTAGPGPEMLGWGLLALLGLVLSPGVLRGRR